MTQTVTEVIHKGELLLLSEGAYSDYGVLCAGRATQDFEPAALSQEFRAMSTKAGNECAQFIKWLVVDKGLIEEYPYREWLVGTYGNLYTEKDVKGYVNRNWIWISDSEPIAEK